jgi:hypothetical protein
MAAWTEADRVRIRNALGFGAIFKQRYALLESAMDTVLSIADGGASPDNSTQLHILSLLTKLDTLFTDMERLWRKTHAVEVDEVKVDVARGLAVLRGEGRRIVKMLSNALATDPKSDIFSPGQYDTGIPFNVSGTGY